MNDEKMTGKEAFVAASLYSQLSESVSYIVEKQYSLVKKSLDNDHNKRNIKRQIAESVLDGLKAGKHRETREAILLNYPTD
ncbi:MAG: hypothetical protein ABIA04_03290 [Pseudomonadota bacterium]